MCTLHLAAHMSSTGVASTDYRTMWVSTAGVDSPQCILDTLTGINGPLYPARARNLNESCRSLNYAITHIKNYTMIVVLCGTHEIKPLDDSSPDSTPLSNIKRLSIEGKCLIGLP